MAAAPMIAPIIGGWIIEALSWRWVFFLQSLLGIISGIGVLLFMTGSISMWIISQDWHDKIIVMGWLGTLSAIVTIIFWIGINRFLTVKLP